MRAMTWLPVTISLSATLAPFKAYSVDLSEIIANCNNMNTYAWADYEQALVGQPITGTGKLRVIDANYGNPGSPLQRAMGILHIDPKYTLIFQSRGNGVEIAGYGKQAIIDLKEGVTMNYSARQIRKIYRYPGKECQLSIKAQL